MLALVVRAVADPNRPRLVVALEVVEDPLLELTLPPTPYITCRSPGPSAASATKFMKSFASQSKPSVYRPHSANVESRIQL